MAQIQGGGPAGLHVKRDATMPSGGGTGYLGTVEGIAVYRAQAQAQQAILCSGRLLRAITYGVVHGRDDIADFSFVDAADLNKSRVRLKFAQHIEWADDVFVEFAFHKEVPG